VGCAVCYYVVASESDWRYVLLKPSTHWWQSRLLPIRSTLSPVWATNRQQLQFDSLSPSTLGHSGFRRFFCAVCCIYYCVVTSELDWRSTLSPIRSTLSPECRASFRLCRQCVRGQSDMVDFVDSRSTFRLSTKSTVLNATSSPVCTGLYWPTTCWVDDDTLWLSSPLAKILDVRYHCAAAAAGGGGDAWWWRWWCYNLFVVLCTLIFDSDVAVAVVIWWSCYVLQLRFTYLNRLYVQPFIIIYACNRDVFEHFISELNSMPCIIYWCALLRLCVGIYPADNVCRICIEI